MKLPCSVTRDLLPLYAEKMVEQETEKLIEEHLADCPACREKLSHLETGNETPVDTAKSLQTLKKEIRKRRWYAAAMAALCVFVLVFTYFYHQNTLQLVPWEDGLIEVQGIEKRPYEEVSAESAGLPESQDAFVDVLVLKADSRINGTEETTFRDDDGTLTFILQGWSSHTNGRSLTKEYGEIVFCPVPDRLIYGYGESQKLLWGEPMNGGVQVLPRLALASYVTIAAVLAAVSGALWFIFRKRSFSWIPRQVCFAPLAYLIAHFLLKGTHSSSFFLTRDFVDILVVAAALYILMSLAWQVWLRRRKERE